jgi:hypothetical protein
MQTDSKENLLLERAATSVLHRELPKIDLCLLKILTESHLSRTWLS